jgi:hypothetical protein
MKNLIVGALVLFAMLVSHPASAAFRCTPSFATNAPEESQWIQDAASQSGQAAAFQAIDGVVSKVKALWYPTSQADASASVKCIANDLVFSAHGAVDMVANLKAWISIH